ncbi:MAG: indolepyruvate oxidoreductase subunit beta [Candidatus Cloacimonetes bacterium]|nr:indolepyruvate oxidoreductase subunit beta [Candidatus Cloacimonadota bacterium]
MKSDIILAGVGGQGILTIATIIGYAALESNLHLKQSEVHGMSQRGGDVQSHLRISDKEIFSDLIPLGSANIIVSVEPMESLRYLPFLAKDGWLITNTTPYINTATYPEKDKLLAEIGKLPHSITIDADILAKEMGAPRAMNMIMLGAVTEFIDLPYEKFQEGIKFIFNRKGEDIVNVNLKAMDRGKEIAQKR